MIVELVLEMVYMCFFGGEDDIVGDLLMLGDGIYG